MNNFQFVPVQSGNTALRGQKLVMQRGILQDLHTLIEGLSFSGRSMCRRYRYILAKIGPF